MLRLQLNRQPDFKVADWRLRAAADAHYDLLVRESAQLYLGDDLQIVYVVLPEEPQDLLAAFRGTSYFTGARTWGLACSSRTVGYLPRLTVRRDFCTLSSMAREHPTEHAAFVRYAEEAGRLLAEYYPPKHAEQVALLEREVRPEWRLAGTPFTSGIVNQDNALHYHTDTGNFPNTWNAMYATSFDCVGGHLVLPEFRVAFSFERAAYIVFPAQDVLHGVTPLRKRGASSYRYSVVYYALRQLCHCQAPADELRRIQTVKTRRELERAGLKEWAGREAVEESVQAAKRIAKLRRGR